MPIDAPITALAPWFGGKRTLADEIVCELGTHKFYYEPFCGSMAVLFAKPPCSDELVNDLHGDLINLARVVQGERYGELANALERTLYCEDLFLSSRSRFLAAPPILADADPDFDRAADFLIVSWMGRNGAAGTERGNYQFTLRYTSNGGSQTKRWRGVSESVPAWHDRLRNVGIVRRDGIALLDKIDDVESTVVYCDPPYLVKGAKYLHDFAAVDHAMLATALCRFKRARIVVSYYDHPRLAELYPGWTKRPLDAQKVMALQNAKGSKREDAPEVILINGPSLVAPEMFMGGAA